GNIVIDMREGKLITSHLEVVEPPRYFEAMIKGFSYVDIALITSRICGICSVGHQMTSLKATEKALGIPVTDQTVVLRKLLTYGATMQSHLLHIFFLAAPDLLGVPSVVPLAASHPDVVKMALRMKKLSNDICDKLGGRTIHPNRLVPGGFTKLPTTADLKWIRDMLVTQMVPDAKTSLELLKTLAGKFPAFERETEYVGLRDKSEYGFYDGQIASTDTGLTPVDDYLSITNEFVVPHSTAKHCRHARSSYFVGALGRLNNNFDLLNPLARKAADELGLKPVVKNPFLNSAAQLVETFHVVEESLKLLDQLIARGVRDEKPVVPDKLREGRGAEATEVPRGILFHDYTYDNRGQVVKANCIIPTTQNTQSIDDDMKELVPWMITKGMTQDQMTLTLEMLVRAYDPCISCSVHFLDVEFRK
ncbi:MAG TPA: nickel-dependent hydrogenase large subunit, partial [Spirochaetia bacterium]|nr:nickel-dependent hydrogenase large subunit [Spirochaetia bacterium]